jgi:serine/threonine-protein kinase HipA
MPVGNGTAFVCRRFDREGDVRIHTEDFAQILDRPAGPSQYHGSYEEIAKVLQWIASDHLEEFIKVVIFCVFCGNGDAHLKNFSVLYTDGRTATLSPAYDLVSTVVYYAPRRENLALELGGSKNFPPFHSQRFEQLFRLAGWDFERGEQFFNETVDRVMASWQDAGISQLFSTVHREKIELHMKTIR